MLRDRYYIAKCSYSQASRLICENHYLGKMGPCSFAFGLFEKQADFSGLFPVDKMVGVITYGTPSSAPLRRGICGEEEKENVIELSRLWICDSVPKNGESFLIGNTIKQVDKEIVVTFAEIDAGHVGTVYQASNFIYTGLSAKRTNWKIRGYNGHSQTLADRYTVKELREIYGDAFYTEDRPRKHRYVFFNSNHKGRKRLKKALKYPIHPYPKRAFGGICKKVL